MLKYSEIKTLENRLLEYSRSVTVANFAQAIASRAATDTYLKSQGVDPVEAVVTAAEAADPTKNQQYVTWIIRQYTKNNIRYEDIYKLKDDLAVFLKTKGQHKRLGVNSDINQYNWQSLARVADQLGSTELAEPTADAGPVEDADVLYNGPLGILSIPRTEAASCALGSGTRWCTAAEKNNMYSSYSKYGPLYVWHDKKRKEKYQFHFETGQFMNAQDEPLTAEDARYLIDENPVTKKFFDQNHDKFEEVLQRLEDYNEREPEYDDDGPYDRPPSDLEEMALDANFEFILQAYDGKEIAYFFKKLRDELAPHIRMILQSDSRKRDEFEKEYIRGNPRIAQDVAMKLYKGPAPHLEDLIAQDGASAYLYAYYSLNKQRFEKAEAEIAKTPWSALNYATKILKQRWPAGEEAIKQQPNFWKEYKTAFKLD